MGNTIIKRCYTESLGDGCDYRHCKPQLVCSRKIKFPPLPRYSVQSVQDRKKSDIAQRGRKRRNPGLTGQRKFSKLWTRPYSCPQQPKGCCKTPRELRLGSRQVSPPTQARGCVPGAGPAPPAPEGKMISVSARICPWLTCVFPLDPSFKPLLHLMK